MAEKLYTQAELDTLLAEKQIEVEQPHACPTACVPEACFRILQHCLVF